MTGPGVCSFSFCSSPQKWMEERWMEEASSASNPSHSLTTQATISHRPQARHRPTSREIMADENVLKMRVSRSDKGTPPVFGCSAIRLDNKLAYEAISWRSY